MGWWEGLVPWSKERRWWDCMRPPGVVTAARCPRNLGPKIPRSPEPNHRKGTHQEGHPTQDPLAHLLHPPPPTPPPQVHPHKLTHALMDHALKQGSALVHAAVLGLQRTDDGRRVTGGSRGAAVLKAVWTA